MYISHAHRGIAMVNHWRSIRQSSQRAAQIDATNGFVKKFIGQK